LAVFRNELKSLALILLGISILYNDPPQDADFKLLQFSNLHFSKSALTPVSLPN